MWLARKCLLSIIFSPVPVQASHDVAEGSLTRRDKPVWQHRFDGLRARRLHVYKRLIRQMPGRQLPKHIDLASEVEWRIDEDDVVGSCAVGKPGIGRATFETNGIAGLKRLDGARDRGGGEPVRLDQRDLDRTARGRFEAQRATAGKEIETSRTDDLGLEPVEQRLTQPISGRPQALDIRDIESTPSPATTDDADTADGARRHRTG